MQFADVRARLGEQPARDLLAQAVGNPHQQQLRALVETYQIDPHRFAFGWVRGGEVVAVIGVELVAPGEALLQHLAVSSSHQRRGLGRSLIREVVRELSLSVLSGETDAEARDFYASCGFVVSSLGERYPGVERFSCRWRVA